MSRSTQNAASAADAPAPAPTREFDIGDYDLESAASIGAEMEIRHPITGEPTGVFIRVVGSDSQQYRDGYRKIIDAAQRDQRQNLDPSVYELRAAQAVAATLLGWRSGENNYMLYGGRKLAFSYENAITVLVARRFVREQVEAFTANRSNFFSDSRGSSAAP